MPLTSAELAAAEAARFTELVEQVLEGKIPAPGEAVTTPDAPQSPGTSPAYAREDHAHGPAEPPDLSLGGDLSGSLADAMISNLQGMPLDAAAPGDDQVLAFRDDKWQPVDAQPPIQLQGDVTGLPAEAVVVALRGVPVGPETPEVGQLLGFIGDAWRPVDPPEIAEPELPEATDGQTIRKAGGEWAAHDWPTDQIGSRVYHDAGMPAAEIGVDGDVHFDHASASAVVVSFKEGGAWAEAFTIGDTAAPPPPPPPPPPDDALPGDIVNAAGEVVPSAYFAMAYQLIQTPGITYRFGQPAPAPPQGFPTLPERDDEGFISHGGGNNVYFSHGPENNTDPNLYMTVNGTAIGKPNSGTSIADAVQWLQVVAVDRETWQQRPQRLWQDNVALPPDISNYESRNELEYNDPADLPVCTFRASGADAPATRLSLVCTQGSATRKAKMFTTGTYTAHNEAICEFELGYVPTAIAVTAGGEFAFVTVWDTNTTTGKVAVVSLGSTSQGSPLRFAAPHERYDWWHGWMDMMHPGFFDQGNWIFMKVLGYVDLPAGCKAPTSIAASTGMDPMAHITYAPDITSFAMVASPMADNRARMLPGGDFYEKYAKGGLAVVGSKSEKRLVFIDLTPLFEYTNGMYLDSAASNLETQDMGIEPDKWPFTFANMPAGAQPVVFREIVTDEAVQDVGMATSWGYWNKDDREREYQPDGPFQDTPHFARAWSVSPGGKMRIFSTGRYLPGVLPTSTEGGGRVPGDIDQVGTVEGLGDNITSLSGLEAHPDVPHATNGGALFVDRQNRLIGLVKFTTPADGLTTTGAVQTVIQDSRMQDPLHATIADPYHTTGNTLCVADYGASQLRNYRYGPVTYGGDTPWSPAPTLTPAGEYAGGLACTFKPIQVFASNTP